MKKFILPLWILVAGALTLYSFTQVSLSLTLTQVSVWQSIQSAFQYIGYFNRPLSASLYSVIIFALFIMYGMTLYFIHKNQVSKKIISSIILLVSGIIFLSYSAFSFDIFNYIFDAKIVTEYGQNPYARKALDFPGDPMLSFMQWTHRTYPYGPVWLGVSVPLSYVGLQFFLPTFYLFKLLALTTFLGSAWLIYKIVSLHKKEHSLFAAAFFALNPLMIIEFLVSAHNDIVMIFLALAAIYLYLRKRTAVSVVLFLLSVGVKYATGFLAPMAAYLFIRPKRWERAVAIGIFSMIIAVIAASVKSGNFQPWYASYFIAIASLISFRRYIYVPVGFFSCISCFHYIPFLYAGNWEDPIPSLLYSGLLITSVITVTLFSFFYFSSKRRSK